MRGREGSNVFFRPSGVSLRLVSWGTDADCRIVGPQSSHHRIAHQSTERREKIVGGGWRIGAGRNHALDMPPPQGRNALVSVLRAEVLEDATPTSASCLRCGRKRGRAEI